MLPQHVRCSWLDFCVLVCCDFLLESVSHSFWDSREFLLYQYIHTLCLIRMSQSVCHNVIYVSVAIEVDTKFNSLMVWRQRNTSEMTVTYSMSLWLNGSFSWVAKPEIQVVRLTIIIFLEHNTQLSQYIWL